MAELIPVTTRLVEITGFSSRKLFSGNKCVIDNETGDACVWASDGSPQSIMFKRVPHGSGDISVSADVIYSDAGQTNNDLWVAGIPPTGGQSLAFWTDHANAKFYIDEDGTRTAIGGSGSITATTFVGNVAIAVTRTGGVNRVAFSFVDRSSVTTRDVDIDGAGFVVVNNGIDPNDFAGQHATSQPFEDGSGNIICAYQGLEAGTYNHRYRLLRVALSNLAKTELAWPSEHPDGWITTDFQNPVNLAAGGNGFWVLAGLGTTEGFQYPNLWYSTNDGSSWQQITLDLPAAVSVATMESQWRGAHFSLYSSRSGNRVFAVPVAGAGSTGGWTTGGEEYAWPVLVLELSEGAVSHTTTYHFTIDAAWGLCMDHPVVGETVDGTVYLAITEERANPNRADKLYLRQGTPGEAPFVPFWTNFRGCEERA